MLTGAAVVSRDGTLGETGMLADAGTTALVDAGTMVLSAVGAAVASGIVGGAFIGVDRR